LNNSKKVHSISVHVLKIFSKFRRLNMQTGKTKTTVAVTAVVLTGMLAFSMLVIVTYSGPVAAQQNSPSSINELRAGKNLIPTKVYTTKDDEQILKLFDGLRVADVSDGMDKVGLTNTGLMSPEIHALWKDTKHYTHRFIGIALTVRYVPTNKPPAPPMETGAFDRWVGQWYNKLSSEPFVPLIRKGTALIIDDAPDSDVGSIGSNNIMGWKVKGCVGVVTNATARDTDEIATEKVPLYFRKPGRGIRPGRNEIESVNRPIVCGGVLVEPGDVIVADGDGVIVVPRAHAKEVAEYAKKIIEGDKAGRRRLYKQLGLPPDDSVE
jgi:4-hydroxy-4-methyl-2-oxoglutarate aldolase